MSEFFKNRTQTLTASEAMPGVYFAAPSGKLLEDFQTKYADAAESEDSLILFKIGLWLFKHVLRDEEGNTFKDVTTLEAVKKVEFTQLSGAVVEFTEMLNPQKKSMESGSA